MTLENNEKILRAIQLTENWIEHKRKLGRSTIDFEKKLDHLKNDCLNDRHDFVEGSDVSGRFGELEFSDTYLSCRYCDVRPENE